MENDARVELVTLVDAEDHVIGAEEKLRAHRDGMLHRAFSIFIFDRERRLLIQRRASSKYHSAGLWSNTCCGHPRPGEAIRRAAARRLSEEMGFGCDLQFAFKLLYRADLGAGMIEHEIDHVFVGRFDGAPRPVSREVAAFAWVSTTKVRERIRSAPDAHSYWLKLVLDSPDWAAVDRVLERIQIGGLSGQSTRT